ncbi:MAG: hypothetical protein WAK13_13225, partial [Terriglobales bacterium]
MLTFDWVDVGVPSGAKAARLGALDGTAEAVPFHEPFSTGFAVAFDKPSAAKAALIFAVPSARLK